MKIHPYLLARISAIHSAFEQAGYKSIPAVAAGAVASSNSNSKPVSNSTSIWDDLLKDKDDKDGGSGGGSGESGGGTMKGLRGKNHISAMRRLGR